MLGNREDRMRELEARHPVWEERTIWQRFDAAACETPDNEFVVSSRGMRLSYRQARSQVVRIATALGHLGVREGDAVAVRLGNCGEAILLALALAYCGATRVALNAGIGPYETAYAIAKARARFLFADGEVRFTSQGAPACLESAVLLGLRPSAQSAQLSWGEFISRADGACPASVARQDPRAVSDIIFTSGSTGNPKGVPLTHDQVQRSAYANALNRGFEAGRRIAVPLPLCHCYGYIEGMLAALFVGGATLVWEGSFQARGFLEFLACERANDALVVPIQAMKCLDELGERPIALDALHAMYCGGSACPAWVLSAIRRGFGINDIVNGYGMSETSGAVMQTVPGDADDVVASRVGKMLPGGCAGEPCYGGHLAEYRVVDRETGCGVPAGEAGELLCRGPVVMRGYVDEPEKNAEIFLDGGWMRTGDIGRFDADGYLELLGRTQEVYRINGENVSPRFVESVIGSSPLVSEAYVVGVPDARLGAVGALFAQLVEDTPPHRAQLEAFCKEALAGYQVPRYYRYLRESDWPRTETGKVRKFKLRQMLAL